MLDRCDSKASLVGSDAMDGQLYIAVGQYRGTTLAMKKIRKYKVDVNRALLQEMRQV